MLARIQRATILLLGISCIAWAVLSLAAGRPAWSVGGFVLVLTGYAAVLAAEFACAAVINRDDPTPYASFRQRFLAWVREITLGLRVFGGRQPWRPESVPDRLEPISTATGKPRRAVVFVHGFACNRAFWNPWMQRLAANGVPYIAVNLEPPFAAIDDYRPTIGKAVESAARACGGAAPVVVAHSMGGLAVRAWLNWAPSADSRVHRVITMGTPHRGTWLARFAFSANGRNMALDGAWIRALAEREPTARRSAFICFFSHCDNVVFPASTATLPGAINVHVPGRAHVDLAFAEEPQRALFDCLEGRL